MFRHFGTKLFLPRKEDHDPHKAMLVIDCQFEFDFVLIKEAVRDWSKKNKANWYFTQALVNDNSNI